MPVVVSYPPRVWQSVTATRGHSHKELMEGSMYNNRVPRQQREPINGSIPCNTLLTNACLLVLEVSR